MNATLRKNLVSLGIDLGIPLMILSPNLFWTGFSVAASLGGGTTGAVRAYLLAMLLPVVHELGSALTRRDWSFLAVYGMVSSVVSGALAFWFVDGFWYAFKTAVTFFLQGLLFLGSALMGVPLLKPVLAQGLEYNSPATHRRALEEAMAHSGMARAFRLGGVMFGLSKLLFGSVRLVAALHVVTASFGTDAFNAQVAFLKGAMYLPGLLFGTLATAPTMLLLERSVKDIYGSEASLLKPEQLVRTLAPAR